MKFDGQKNYGSRSLGYTLVEVIISMLILSIMVVSLYAGFSSGFAIVKLSRENLQATQILSEKLETVRIFNWNQLTNASLFRRSFGHYYDPSGLSNNSAGTFYQGYISVTNVPTSIPGDYRNNMLAITVSVYWTNYPPAPREPIIRSRQMQTYVARFGLQDYRYQ